MLAVELVPDYREKILWLAEEIEAEAASTSTNWARVAKLATDLRRYADWLAARAARKHHSPAVRYSQLQTEAAVIISLLDGPGTMESLTALLDHGRDAVEGAVIALLATGAARVHGDKLVASPAVKHPDALGVVAI
jgi:hypothetical protein